MSRITGGFTMSFLFIGVIAIVIIIVVVIWVSNDPNKEK